MRWLAPLLLLNGCGSAPAIPPGGIVSNNPCIDAILAKIAAPRQIAAVSTYSHDAASGSAPLAWARAHPAIGSTAEEIIAAKPRLVLTGNLASSGTNAALTRAGIDVIALGVPATLSEGTKQIRLVAKAIGRFGAGEKLIQNIESAVQIPKQRAEEEAPLSAVIWQSGGFVAGKGTLQDDLLTHAGFRNASVQFGLKQWDILPLETLVRNPPDVIFAAKPHLLFARLKNTKIVQFPDRLSFCGGPMMIEAMRVMKAAR